MMYYAIINSGIITGKNIAEINKQLDAKFEEEEFQCFGVDKVTNLTDLDVEFVRDKKKMSKIFFGNFFKEDKSVKLFILITMLLTIISIVMISQKTDSIMTGIEKLVEALKGVQP